MSARRALVLLVLLLGATRLWHVAALGDVFFYGEELEKGAAAKAILDALGVPHHQLAYHYYEGGGFLISHLNALAFLLVGESLLALKLVSLSWTVAVLVAGHRFVDRHFGRGAATVFGLSFVLAPEAFQKLSLLDLGIHFEALLFVTLVLDRTFRILFDDRPRRRDFVALGLAAGFGTWFSYQVAPVGAFALLALGLRRPRALLRGAPFGLLATALGALPLVWMGSRVGDEVLNIHGGALFGSGSEPALERIGRTVGAFAGSILDVGPRHLWAPIGLTLALGVALARGRALLGEPGRARAAWLALVLFLVFEVAVYLSSDFAVGRVEHYFQLNRTSLLWWALVVVCAPVLAALWTRRAPVGRPLVVALVAAGAAASVAIGLDGRPRAPLANLAIVARTKGYAYPQYLAKIWGHLEGDDETKLRLLGRFQEPDADGAAELRVALGMQLHDPARSFAELHELLRRVDPEHVDDYVAGLGTWLMRRHGLDPSVRLAHLPDYPAAFHGALVEAIARIGRGLQVTREHLLAEARIAWPAAHAERAARGFGERLRAWARLDPDRAADLLAAVDPSVRERLRRGYEAALRAHRLDGR